MHLSLLFPINLKYLPYLPIDTIVGALYDNATSHGGHSFHNNLTSSKLGLTTCNHEKVPPRSKVLLENGRCDAYTKHSGWFCSHFLLGIGDTILSHCA